MQPQRKPVPTDPAPVAPSRREELRRRMAEHGVTLHLPDPARPRGEWPRLPVSADELSAAVIRMRRGDV